MKRLFIPLFLLSACSLAEAEITVMDMNAARLVVRGTSVRGMKRRGKSIIGRVACSGPEA